MSVLHGIIIDRITRDPRSTNWDSYTRHLSDNLVYLRVSSDIRSEIELEIALEDYNTVVVDAFETNRSAKTSK